MKKFLGLAMALLLTFGVARAAVIDPTMPFSVDVETVARAAVIDPTMPFSTGEQI